MTTRRVMGLLTAGTIATTLLAAPAWSQAMSTASVEQAVEKLRLLMLDPDRAALEGLIADQLTYGHSDGRVQNKAELIDALVTRTSEFKSITLSAQTVSIVGDVAIVRHRFAADAVSNGKPGQPRIAVLQIWHLQGGAWKLLVRQAH